MERLAQANPEHRQTIVNVICAYLRMPFTPPREFHVASQHGSVRRPRVPGTGSTLIVVSREDSTDSPTDRDRAEQTDEEEREAQQELQVLLAAQRILASHLRPFGFLEYAESVWNVDPEREPLPRFWEGMQLDLVGAYLADFDFAQCQVTAADFSNAFFDGSASFNGAAFISLTLFHGAVFQHGAWFRGATFVNGAGFGATFHGSVHFENAEFGEESGLAVEVDGKAWFNEARFADARFDLASFGDDVYFNDVTFEGDVSFDNVQFRGEIDFSGATVCCPEARHHWPLDWSFDIDQDGTGRLKRNGGTNEISPAGQAVPEG